MRSTRARVAVSTTATKAPGSTAPCVSFTTPLISAVLYCAALVRGAIVNRTRQQTISAAEIEDLCTLTAGHIIRQEAVNSARELSGTWWGRERLCRPRGAPQSRPGARKHLTGYGSHASVASRKLVVHRRRLRHPAGEARRAILSVNDVPMEMQEDYDGNGFGAVTR